MREPQFASHILERSRKRDRAAVRVGVNREVVANTIARGANVALFKTRPQRHYLVREHCREFSRNLWIAVKFGEDGGLWIQPNDGIGGRDSVTVVGR